MSLFESKMGLPSKICDFEMGKQTEQVVPPTLMNIGSSTNYSHICQCYSIHMHWVYAVLKQTFWRHGNMLRNIRHCHLSCFRNLHLSSTSASTAYAKNHCTCFLGEIQLKKRSHNVCFHFCTHMTTVCCAALKAALLACWHLVWCFNRNKGRKGTSKCGCPFNFLVVLVAGWLPVKLWVLQMTKGESERERIRQGPG